jgi:uncharacterized protein (DUF2267 family)
MDDYDFFNRVSERGEMTTEREVLVATEATLKTLGERLTEVEAVRLAQQLPPDIGRFLTVVDMDKKFDLQGFYEHVAEREHLDAETSRQHAQAVLSIVEEIVGSEELRDMLARLPDEFHNLLMQGD